MVTHHCASYTMILDLSIRDSECFLVPSLINFFLMNFFMGRKSGGYLAQSAGRVRDYPSWVFVKVEK